MRVLSMVPSWTETLLAGGVDVVGRTRFCIHPKTQIQHIPAIGGTKDIDWQKVRDLRPDLIVLDREENPLSMAIEAPCEVFATHVQRIEDVANELERLSHKLSDSSKPVLDLMVKQWREVDSVPSLDIKDWAQLPGVIEWIREAPEWASAVYLIWREPWMSANKGTFIASVLEKVGVRTLWQPRDAEQIKYPAFSFEEIPADTVLLCSSEPFPFAKPKFRQELEVSGRPCALVDGEVFSWFGIRSLSFLQHALKLSGAPVDHEI